MATYVSTATKRGRNAEGRLEHYLLKNQQKNKSRAFLKPEGKALKATLDYKSLKKLDRYSLLEVKPITGRHHQIRVQLASMSCIIKGDLKYGDRRSNKDASICLHARQIDFIHPVKKEAIRIIAPPPKDSLWDACL